MDVSFFFYPKGKWIEYFCSRGFLRLPLPIPFSNLTVALSMFLIGLVVLEGRGAFGFIAYLVSLLAFAFLLSLTKKGFSFEAKAFYSEMKKCIQSSETSGFSKFSAFMLSRSTIAATLKSDQTFKAVSSISIRA